MVWWNIQLLGTGTENDEFEVDLDGEGKGAVDLVTDMSKAV